ncbi:hypothetical protein OS493_031895 [Desmophyllum pertusum]|uniref:Pru domain-containing protein n=1 Tax=Desmophyllum pertusum TaxID=174260 RepID=A0A9W9YBN3_9CNID|nr:hypothetical protein OS493_031895 [Desmophyllum pertusum]
MEDSWELVAVPAEIQHSTNGKEASLDASEASLERTRRITNPRHIDVANASFTFEVEDADRLTQFQICTSGRIYQLQAKDKQTMMFWLQELQQSTCGLLAEEEDTENEKEGEVTSGQYSS